MKKPTKTATTPAKPAPAPAKKKPAEAKVAKAPEVKAPAKKPATKLVPAEAPAAAEGIAAPLAKSPQKSGASTVITAKIDVGFGNSLYLRGEGPGLSWESGRQLDCVSDDEWSITFENVEKPIVFKFLVNDLTWCSGEDFVVSPGSSLTVTPTF